MKDVHGGFNLQVLQVIAGCLVAGSAIAQTGKYKNLPDVTISSDKTAVTTPAVRALGTGTVKFILGKPEPSRGTCSRVQAEILRFTTSVETIDLKLCDSRSREIQTPHNGIAAYALRLTLLDHAADRSVRFSAMKVFYPSNVQPITLTVAGMIQLAPGQIQSRDITVPAGGRLMIRTKWSPTVRVYTYLQRTDGTVIHQVTGYDGVSTLSSSVPAGGTYRIAVRNSSPSMSAQVAIDRVELTASSY